MTGLGRKRTTRVLDQSFQLKNLGMDAFKVEVSVTPGREGSFPLTRPNLRRDAWIRFSVAINSFSTADQFFA